jgi:hypothetical protein
MDNIGRKMDETALNPIKIKKHRTIPSPKLSKISN